MEQKQMYLEIKKIEQFLHNIKILIELGGKSPNKSVLKTYKGFGGLRSCFNSKGLYGMLMKEIRFLFGQEREHEIFNTLRDSCKSAYYTPSEIVTFMYRYLKEVCNFKGGDILEPACGNGIFFEHMPQDIKENSSIVGVEPDIVTSKIVQATYHDIKIINRPIQEVDFANAKYDLIIGNPPYSKEIITNDKMEDLNNNIIHNYFAAKCVRLLKNNGILAFVMPAYFLDFSSRNTRSIINNEAVLIDALRLPDNLFEQATVTVDIIFFRKTGNQLHQFCNTVKFEYEGREDFINEFWFNNPNKILGKLYLKWVEAYKRYIPSCRAINPDKTLESLANYELNNTLKENFINIIKEQPQEIENPLKGKLLNLIERLQNLLNVSASNLSLEVENLIKIVQELF